ncbi:diguanylate cyclase domain-containing protein [Arcobacter defluvii]|uniref:Multi-sensor domain-containing diguanylate cyclase n=1 Tax=Arcobacter defluvii TaxID=873191 RepID=A0AAE7E800_9BACT|nr:diguanylate cyclase [Arcobacter defluvii]QKF78068.1 multi-sensor domain-containing diguanylate cyclase [Arcobacter defluvii]RXI30013.1 diguanylate cyclase [Arcobacter defluvii]
MLKNTLFLKIIIIFTLPALGILYFSSVLVLEKVELTKEIDDTYDNLTYLKSVEKLISNFEEERDLSVKYFLLRNEFPQLEKQQNETTKSYNNLINIVKNLNLESKFNQFKIDIKKIDDFRNKIDNFSISIDEVFEGYNVINRVLLNSLSLMKPIKFAIEFNTDLSNVVDFLNFKEASYIEKSIIKIYLEEKKLDDKLYDIFLRNYSIQEINKDSFYNVHSLSSLQNFNIKFNEDYLNKIFILRNNIKNKIEKNSDFKFEDWEYISNENIDYLSNIYNNLIYSIEKTAMKYEDDIIVERNKSLIFLFVCFSTLISLLFVLRNIIFNEQKSFYKVQKHKEIYELLNQANKFLLKTFDKKRLYSNICELLLENENLQFCFIYDLSDKEIIANEGKLKDKIITQMDKYHDKTKDNIISKTIKWETNIIINNFKEKNISVFYENADELNINSMATFPIKKFNQIVGTLVIYSNELNFFDQEVEILFDKLVNDVTHCLEKIEYEEIRVKQEDELRLSSYAFESSEPMIITNNAGEIIKVNQAFCTTMGYTREEILGKNPRIFKSGHQNSKFGDELWNSLRIQGFWSGEVYNRKANDEIIPLRSTITAIKDKDGKITHFLGQYIDIGEQKDKEKVLEYQATHDNLTGLPNRLLLLDRIEHAITKVVRHKIVGGLIFIDLDNFKEVNDTLGHDIGDALLIMVAKKIAEVIRDEDTIARIGGDEFIVLIDNIGNNKIDAKTNITNLAEKIKNVLNGITHIEGHINVSTPSIGITLFSDSSVSVKDIIKQADTAMYVAKKQGKNAIEFFD